MDEIDRQGLGAIRFADATTGLPVTAALEVRAPGVRLTRTLQGWFAILAAPGAEGAVGSAALEMTVRDPAGVYLPRRFALPFPRDPDPARSGRAESVFQPVEVALFRSPAARVAPNWAVVRGFVRHRKTDAPLPGALIRVVRRGNASDVLARGLSDPRGEALVAVPGIPITTWEEGAGRVLTTEVEVRLEVVWDPAAGDVPDPDDLEERRSKLRVRTKSATLAAGRVLVKAL